MGARFPFSLFLRKAGRYLLASLLFSGPVFAMGPTDLAGPELARQKHCLACHQVDKRRVGPPFRAVAQRYHGQAEAASYLAGSVRHGSSGQWGAIPMPAQTGVSEEEARQLIEWILSLARE